MQSSPGLGAPHHPDGEEMDGETGMMGWAGTGGGGGRRRGGAAYLTNEQFGA